ncbi:uncharacterized protein Bfra_003790 [Botrytis fragariae]|uniref:Uncharacterized protein n=1 Tax=Botrytis fragariae TaxID=1964551 RepID=A0A8H6AX30_9HELO|nr:uncharacterized protein Bfra_003790 [Botrytis fragariae]KAF5875336.1 hypothetical protein Bfra_003790 [Botrytis fragariae]
MKGRGTSSWIIFTESTSTYEAMIPEKSLLNDGSHFYWNFYPAIMQHRSFGAWAFIPNREGIYRQLDQPTKQRNHHPPWPKTSDPTPQKANRKTLTATPNTTGIPTRPWTPKAKLQQRINITKYEIPDTLTSRDNIRMRLRTDHF